jgi:hypothetical protein
MTAAKHNRVSLLLPNNEHTRIIIVLLVALLHGMIYLWIQPPWQHYDEPGHFEYAWLLAHPEEQNQPEGNVAIRREIAASMIEHHFFEEDALIKPNLMLADEEVWIGVSQVGDLPVYYWLVSIPLRIIANFDITLQMHSARFVSLFMFLVTVFSSYGFACELTPNGHSLRWSLPLSIALLPSFVDVMTAINNDVGATCFASLFLWAAVRMLVRGFSWKRAVMVTVFAVLAIFSKTTVVVIAVVLPIVMLAALIPSRWHKKFLWLLGGVVLLAIFALIDINGLSNWHTLFSTRISLSSESALAPLGERVFQVQGNKTNSPYPVFQPLTLHVRNLIRGKEVVVGSWIWADLPSAQQSIVAAVPSLVIDQTRSIREVIISSEPGFFTTTVTIPEDSSYARLDLLPAQMSTLPADLPSPVIYYDGVVLIVPENQKPTGMPLYNDPNGATVTWDGYQFENLVQNPSAEIRWLGIRSFVNSLLDKIPNGSLVLSSLSEPELSVAYYQAVIKALGQSFWARFSWGQVKLYGRPYVQLGILSLAGIAGAVFFFLKWRNQLPWIVLFVCSLMLLGVWIPVLFRGLQVLYGQSWLPASRYAFPAIIPTMSVLVVGWRAIAGWLRSVLARNRITAALAGLITPLALAGFVLLDGLSIYSILQYYGQLP